MIKAVLFDLDGVIVDSEPVHLQAFQEVVALFGMTLDREEWKSIVGTSDLCAAEWILAKTPLPITAEELSARKLSIGIRLFENAQAVPGLAALLSDLKQLQKGVVSNGRKAEVEKILSNLHIRHHFRSVITKDSGLKGKPAPDLYLSGAHALGVDPTECLALEDSGAGVSSAKSAGMRCYAIPNEWTERQDFSTADAVLGSLSEVISRMRHDKLL